MVHRHLVQVLHLEAPQHLAALLKVARAPLLLGGTLYNQVHAVAPCNSGNLTTEQRRPASVRNFCYQVRSVCLETADPDNVDSSESVDSSMNICFFITWSHEYVVHLTLPISAHFVGIL